MTSDTKYFPCFAVSIAFDPKDTNDFLDTVNLDGNRCIAVYEHRWQAGRAMIQWLIDTLEAARDDIDVTTDVAVAEKVLDDLDNIVASVLEVELDEDGWVFVGDANTAIGLGYPDDSIELDDTTLDDDSE